MLSNEHTNDKKASSLITDIEKVLGVWSEDSKKIQHSFKPKPNPDEGPKSLILGRLRETRKLQEKSLKLVEVGSRDKERSCLHNIKV